jgi:hypothetical protein
MKSGRGGVSKKEMAATVYGTPVKDWKTAEGVGKEPKGLIGVWARPVRVE